MWYRIPFVLVSLLLLSSISRADLMMSTGLSPGDKYRTSGTRHATVDYNQFVMSDANRSGKLSAGPSVTWTVTASTSAVYATSLGADFDVDGDTDGDDFLIWQSGFGIAFGAAKTDGDYDNDEDVDSVDLAGWQSEFLSPSLTLGDGSISAVADVVTEPFDLAARAGFNVPRVTVAVPEPGAFLFGEIVCSVLVLNFARKRIFGNKASDDNAAG